MSALGSQDTLLILEMSQHAVGLLRAKAAAFSGYVDVVDVRSFDDHRAVSQQDDEDCGEQQAIDDSDGELVQISA